MTTEQTALQRLKKLSEKATPIPWRTLTPDEYDNVAITYHTSKMSFCVAMTNSKDGELIVAARNTLPILIEYCKALEKQEQARSIMDKNEIRYDPCCFYQSQKNYKDATAAVEAAKARLEEACQK